MFSKHFCFTHILELFTSNLSSRILYCEKSCAWLSAHLLCRGLCLREWSCILPVAIIISRWRSLCERSCVDIMKILLCEGGDVELRLEPRNISLCLRLIYFFSLSLSLISCIAYIVHIHMHARYSLCAHACVEPRELLIAPQLLI